MQEMPPSIHPSVQVNGADVVKVGHRQVVALIRQGGSRLLMKVVSVSRKSESNLIRKKGQLISQCCLCVSELTINMSCGLLICSSASSKAGPEHLTDP